MFIYNNRLLRFMAFRFYTQVKGMINILMSVIIVIAVAFLNEYLLYLAIVILVAFIIQIGILFVRSVEEKHFDKEVGHMQKDRELDHNRDEEAKLIKNKEKIKKMREKAKQVTESNKPEQNALQRYRHMRDLLYYRKRK